MQRTVLYWGGNDQILCSTWNRRYLSKHNQLSQKLPNYHWNRMDIINALHSDRLTEIKANRKYEIRSSLMESCIFRPNPWLLDRQVSSIYPLSSHRLSAGCLLHERKRSYTFRRRQCCVKKVDCRRVWLNSLFIFLQHEQLFRFNTLSAQQSGSCCYWRYFPQRSQRAIQPSDGKNFITQSKFDRGDPGTKYGQPLQQVIQSHYGQWYPPNGTSLVSMQVPGHKLKEAGLRILTEQPFQGTELWPLLKLVWTRNKRSTGRSYYTASW